jgi:hypothetical protein
VEVGLLKRGIYFVASFTLAHRHINIRDIALVITARSMAANGSVASTRAYAGALFMHRGRVVKAVEVKGK